jgi:type II secretory pathway pseudopilin PulG
MRLLEHPVIAPAQQARGGRGADFQSAVSQCFQPAGRVASVGLFSRDRSADWKSATQQVGNLRYGRLRRAFTLAEVLAALAFMAIVIPVTVQALRVASFVGQVGDRRAAATRVAERVLNEMVVTGVAGGGGQNGTIQEGLRTYRWTLTTEAWNPSSGRTGDSGAAGGFSSTSSSTSSGTLNLVTVRVAFDVQGEEHDVLLSTLLDTSTTTTGGTSL